ncbi:hypothetical protein [Undibacterium sp. TJN19]|uniref:hypothetical protein n=1 Tax=Undibacterium sp. TJN19 TaxID=3413055 RepID=UPI003BF4F20E
MATLAADVFLGLATLQVGGDGLEVGSDVETRLQKVWVLTTSPKNAIEFMIWGQSSHPIFSAKNTDRMWFIIHRPLQYLRGFTPAKV